MSTEITGTARAQSNAELIEALRQPADTVHSAWNLEVVDDTERQRFLALLGADAIGELTYRHVGGRIVLLSTWVESVYRNQRVASELIARALDQIRQTGKKITIVCPVVGEFIARNPGYAELIDQVHPGDGAGAPRSSR